MIQEAIAKVTQGLDLSEQEAAQAMGQVIDRQATPAQAGALLIGLRMKGETVAEICGAAQAFRSRCEPIPLNGSGVALDRDEINLDRETIADTCGTGGKGTRTFNVSTTTAFVVAGAGLKVAKHGLRSGSGRCGSADVVEALGVSLDLTPGQVGACIDRIGIGFLYGPGLGSTNGRVLEIRRELGIRTLLNLVAPLTNPAKADVQVLGVYDPGLTETMARVLARLGCGSAFVVHGRDCGDEISITGPTRISRLKNGEVSSFTLSPEDLGLKSAPPERIIGGDPARNAAITRAVLGGQEGPCRDMVLLNASAVLTAAGRAKDLEEGLALAARSIDSGRALEKLNLLVAMGLGSSARAGAMG